MKTFELNFVTENGYTWLNESNIPFSYETYKTIIETYYSKNIKAAEQLVSKWRSNGEDVSLCLDIELDYSQFEKNEYVALMTFIDSNF